MFAARVFALYEARTQKHFPCSHGPKIFYQTSKKAGDRYPLLGAATISLAYLFPFLTFGKSC
jgi:hypothetical protein